MHLKVLKKKKMYENICKKESTLPFIQQKYIMSWSEGLQEPRSMSSKSSLLSWAAAGTGDIDRLNYMVVFFPLYPGEYEKNILWGLELTTGNENPLSVTQTDWPGWPQRGRQEGRERPKNKAILLDQDIRWICQEHRTRLGHEQRDTAKNKRGKGRGSRNLGRTDLEDELTNRSQAKVRHKLIDTVGKEQLCRDQGQHSEGLFPKGSSQHSCLSF